MAIETRYETWRLANGLRVVAAHQPWARTFAMSLGFNRGWCHEADGRRGVSHLLEHLAFTGTNRERAERLAEAGILLNAMTAWEHTFFLAAGHATLFPPTLPFFAEILRGPPFDEATVRAELAIIAHEMVTNREAPVELELRRVTAEILGDPTLGRPYPGSVRRLGRMPVESLAEIERAERAPERGCLVVVGPWSRETLEALLQESVADATRPPVEAPLPPARELRPPKPNRLIVRRFPGPQLLVGVAHGFAPRSALPLTAVAVINDLVGGGPHSILFQRIRRDGRLGYEVGSQVMAFTNAVVMQSHAIVRRRAGLAALDHMLDAFDELAGGELDELAFVRARDSVVRGLDCLQDSPGDLCEWLSHEAWTHAGDEVVTPARYQEELLGIRAERAAEIARDLLSPARRTTFVFGAFGRLATARARRRLRRRG
jgi:zinc protease